MGRAAGGRVARKPRHTGQEDATHRAEGSDTPGRRDGHAGLESGCRCRAQPVSGVQNALSVFLEQFPIDHKSGHRHRVLDEPAVEAGQRLQRGLVHARDDFRGVVEPSALVARVDTLRAVPDEELLPRTQTRAGLEDRDEDLLGGAWIARGLEDDAASRRDARGDGGGGVLDIAQIGCVVSPGSRYADDRDVEPPGAAGSSVGRYRPVLNAIARSLPVMSSMNVSALQRRSIRVLSMSKPMTSKSASTARMATGKPT